MTSIKNNNIETADHLMISPPYLLIWGRIIIKLRLFHNPLKHPHSNFKNEIAIKT